ncbi:glycosyltransferase family 2 protein [Clostridium tertium]|uniref:glycosyltransferase family 2 protein n=1 Tax=Clostridium tertium TaxID=1559 RepID=UPI003DA47B29
MDISFIIPIYNTEEHLLLRCFKSILELKYIKYEVLLIDDGSEDFVETFCSNFCNDYEMFHYYKKCNEGVSEARNFGLNKATGKYIFFIDSDDRIVAEALNRSVIESSSDIIIFDMALVNESKMLIWNSFDCGSGKIESKNAILSMMYSGRLNSPCAKLIKRNLIFKNKISFDKNLITGEDADFILKIFQLSPDIYYVNKVVYQYWRTEESGRNRMIWNSDKLIENYEYHALKNIDILDKIQVDIKVRENAKKALISTEVKNLFNLALDLEQEGILLDSLKNKITISIKNINLDILLKCDRLTKIRYNLLYNQMWKVMLYVGYIRNIYLSIRGLHL